jgi:polynucleotide 5'-kinase involved in rRNA processing
MRGQPTGNGPHRVAATTARELGWKAIAEKLHRRVAMVVGGPGAGKTTLVRYLVEQLASQAGSAALVCADMGQPAMGPPSCLALALRPPWDQPAASWFIGDVSPVGNLLPTVVGASRLVERARNEGADSIVIDTTGLVEGPLGRVLKYHKSLACGVDQVVGLSRGEELEPLLALLEGACAGAERLRPAPQARDRPPPERKRWRESRYQAYFRAAEACQFDSRRLLGGDWASGAEVQRRVRSGALVGLLDERGYCLGLGIVRELRNGRVIVDTPCQELAAVARVQLGKVRLDPSAHFSESR